MSKVVDNLRLVSVNTTGVYPRNCRIADVSDGIPFVAGKSAIKISLKPGDCGGNDVFDDCANDRSRFELSESPQGYTQGKSLIRSFRIYLPTQERLRPKGGNALFLSQLNYMDGKNFGTLAYLELGDDGNLYIRTHQGFTFDIKNKYLAIINPYQKWIGVRYEVNSTTESSGFFKVYVDNQLIVNESRPTLPTAQGVNSLRVGIYNAFLSRATEPYLDQVVYFDQIQGQ